MDLKPIFIVLLCLWTSGCAAGSARRAGLEDARIRSFAENYRRAKMGGTQPLAPVPSLTVVEPPVAGYVKPYVPVVRPPQVIKVWIPAHVAAHDRRVMVAGHWAFIMLEPAGWFIDGAVTPVVEQQGIVPLAGTLLSGENTPDRKYAAAQ